ncbi:MAG: GNAT family N-acetyltransferase [Thermovenabulum sp.]|uniref:GNAT family N-acetyltransferase n=1 Tax=Thermovenabulum sp. TaxID=3100335 RepID=UPI003C798DF4
MRIRTAVLKDVESIAEVFLKAFEGSIKFFTPITSGIKRAFCALFTLLICTFKEGVMVAEEENKIVGYIVMADNVKRLWKEAFLSGFIFKFIINYFRGDYGVKIKDALRIVFNKLFFLRFEVNTASSAQLLSIGVLPECHGKGIGKALLEKGMEYIRKKGIKRVKLEVRPNNTSAVKLYERFGFKVKGRTRDLQGEWLIMVWEG